MVLAPFKWELWGSIVAVIVLSGTEHYIVERKTSPESNLRASLFEYFAGFIWGGWDQPLSRTSAVYQLILGFMTLALVASYTANLAAFITVSAQPTISVRSVDEVIMQCTRLCLDASAGYFQFISANYPRLLWEHPSDNVYFDSTWFSAEAYEAARCCAGMVYPLATVNELKTDRTTVH